MSVYAHEVDIFLINISCIYLYKLKVLEIACFIFELLDQRVKAILSEKEKNYLPDILDCEKSWQPLCDLVFVIERFINSRVFPRQYEIVYSSAFDDSNLSHEVRGNLVDLKDLLQKGSDDINNRQSGFLPKSSKQYFNTKYGNTTKKRYIVDFTNQFFGIRHFHLDSHDKKEDVLLYYALHGGKIYFLKIGGHDDLYKQDIVESLIHEFPELLNHLEIGYMPDMPVGNDYKYTIDEMRCAWVSGGNVSFKFNNLYYTSTSPQTLSRLNARIIEIVRNIYREIELQIKQFISYLEEKYPNITESEIEPIDYYVETNAIIVVDEITKEGFEMKIPYLNILNYIDVLIG